MRATLTSLLFILLLSEIISGQTCCSGGVPVSSNLGLPHSQKGTVQLSLNADFNTLKTLKNGNEHLNDDSRIRQTNSILFELGYSLSNRFALEGFLSFVKQERTINQFGNSNFDHSQGFGDGVILFKYKINKLEKFGNWIVGLGPKLPLGSSTKTNDQGISLNADLNPGSGAWDLIFWTQYSKPLEFWRSSSFHSTMIYSLKGTNSNYLGQQSYQFGNEFQGTLGISQRVLLQNLVIDPSLTFRYRNQEEDQLNKFSLSNTGGQWIFINPSFSWWIKQNLSIDFSYTTPIYSNVLGTQLSPTYRFSGGIFLRITDKKSSNDEKYIISI